MASAENGWHMYADTPINKISVHQRGVQGNQYETRDKRAATRKLEGLFQNFFASATKPTNERTIRAEDDAVCESDIGL